MYSVYCKHLDKSWYKSFSSAIFIWNSLSFTSHTLATTVLVFVFPWNMVGLVGKSNEGILKIRKNSLKVSLTGSGKCGRDYIQNSTFYGWDASVVQPVVRWITDDYQLSSNLGMGISDGCFIFNFTSFPRRLFSPFSLPCSQKRL